VISTVVLITAVTASNVVIDFSPTQSCTVIEKNTVVHRITGKPVYVNYVYWDWVNIEKQAFDDKEPQMYRELHVVGCIHAGRYTNGKLRSDKPVPRWSSVEEAYVQMFNIGRGFNYIVADRYKETMTIEPSDYVDSLKWPKSNRPKNFIKRNHPKRKIKRKKRNEKPLVK
jgi:hypothetical protein